MHLNRAHLELTIVAQLTLYSILTAYIISPSRGKGVSFSNSSVLYLRASSMMHCGHRFKYHNYCLPVVSSTEVGEVTLKLSPLSTSPGVGRCCFLHFTRLLPWQSPVSSHNLASRVRAIVYSENDLLYSVMCS